MSRRDPIGLRLALLAVPRAWREMVRDDLADQVGAGRFAGMGAGFHALAIAGSLHWTFTGGALMSDLRDAMGSLLRAKSFALGAIATFALGIGVNLAVLSAVDRMLFRALPYADPDRLVVMGIAADGNVLARGTVPKDEALRARQSPLFTSAAAVQFSAASYRVTENPDDAQYLAFPRVSYATLATLGVRPLVGRDFTDDDARAKKRLVLLRASTWRHMFGGRGDVVGRRMWGQSAGNDAEIAGVLPDDFFPPQPVYATLEWSGIAVDGTTSAGPAPRDPSPPPILRLAPGVTIQTAQAFVSAVEAEHNARTPRDGPIDARLTVLPLRTALFGRLNVYLVGAFVAATLVLLVACANLASLLLVRARSREARAALQLALGASPARVIRTATVEALVLAFAGSAVAVVILSLADRAIAAWLPAIFNAYAVPVLEPRMLAVTGSVALVSAIAVGGLPGWRAARTDVLAVLLRGNRRNGSGRLRGGATILAFEVAISLVLVTCAVLTSRNLARLSSADPGYDPRDLYFVSASLPDSTDVTAQLTRYQGILQILRAMPGVTVAAGGDSMPMMGDLGDAMGDVGRRGLRVAVSDAFAETLRTPVLAGRTISAADVAANAPVAVLSAAGVHLLLPGITPQRAIGRELRLQEDVARQVVGVVADVRWSYHTLAGPLLYVPSSTSHFGFMSYQVRVASGTVLTVTDITSRLKAAGFQLTRVTVSPMDRQLARSIADQRFQSELLSAFGLVALALALVGLYAVGSFVVAQRTTEFGVRLSLGATPGDLRLMLMKQAAMPALVGVAAGLLATIWIARYVKSLLETIDARDPTTYAVVAVTLLLVAVAATLIPARRAARTDPVVALRAQ